jgi:Ca2+-binding EF-hand superfamily protein
VKFYSAFFSKNQDSLKKMDIHKHGELHPTDFARMVSAIRKIEHARIADAGEIHYEHMPEKCKEVLKLWDTDGDGSVSVSELVAAANAQKKMAEENRLVKRLLFAAVIVILLMGVMNFLVGWAAVEHGKDFKPKKSDDSRR